MIDIDAEKSNGDWLRRKGEREKALFDLYRKFNPNHDERGRFTTGPGAAGGGAASSSSHVLSATIPYSSRDDPGEQQARENAWAKMNDTYIENAGELELDQGGPTDILAERAGTDYDNTESISFMWMANRSFVMDADAATAALQKAASEEFGVPLGVLGEKYVRESQDSPVFDHYYDDSKYLVYSAHELTGEFYQGHPELTVEKDGKQYVPLWRGVYVRDGTTESSAYDGIDYTMPGDEENRTIDQAPLRSWTAVEKYALGYAQNQLGLHNKGVGKGYVLSALVPVDRIMANEYTGFGATGMAENVVIGGPMDVKVKRVWG